MSILKVGRTIAFDKNTGVFTTEVFLKEKIHEGMLIYFDPWDCQKNRLRGLLYILLHKTEPQKWRLGPGASKALLDKQYRQTPRTKIRIWRDFILVATGFISEENSGFPISIKNSDITFEALQAVYDELYEFFVKAGFDLDSFNEEHEDARQELEAMKLEKNRNIKKELKSNFGAKLPPTE